MSSNLFNNFKCWIRRNTIFVSVNLPPAGSDGFTVFRLVNKGRTIYHVVDPAAVPAEFAGLLVGRAGKAGGDE